MQSWLRFLLKLALGLALTSTITFAQSDPKIETVPILSGAMAFVPIVDGGQTTLTSVVAPVILVPVGDKWLVESRVTLEGDFARRDGTGPFVGPVEKEIDYAELDYIANRYVTVTAGRFLTPFGLYNERLYPVWVRNLQTEPLTLPLEESSSNGLMFRGGVPISGNVTLNYAAYFSTLSTNTYLDSDRQAGGRVGLFLPNQRVEVGFSLLHKLLEDHDNLYGAHFEWQPRRIPLDLRSEFVDAASGRGYWIEPALRLSSISHLRAITSRTQLVGRVQQFFPHGVPDDDELPAVKTVRSEFGFNYYIADGWRAVASTGREFSAEGNHNIWTVGMTYRFAIPLGRGGL